MVEYWPHDRGPLRLSDQLETRPTAPSDALELRNQATKSKIKLNMAS